MEIKINNDNLLIDRFGRWPSFHDAEVIRVRFEREGSDAPFMECDIHVFEMTSEVDSSGHYVLKNHTLTTLRFCDIELDWFKGWNCQNAIFGLYIDPAELSESVDETERPIQVTMPGAYGSDAKLKCVAIKVIDAIDFKE